MGSSALEMAMLRTDRQYDLDFAQALMGGMLPPPPPEFH